MKRQFSGLCLSLVLAMTSLPALAANIQMTAGESVGSVKLGAADSVLKKNPFGLPLSKSGKDTEYEGQTVYYYFYGKPDANNSYPLQVYSDVKGKVFIFEVNSPQFVLPSGLKIGSSEADLLKAYGNKLKKQKRGSIYIKYSLGDRKGTDFYVKNQKITQILIRSY
ncbi:MAG: hypothetical protein IGS03_02045 [Candidatus Sericytochromatia bacterium]|nr:hypothetical protein [Candidatus Sericytochromatia bacterium]